MSNRAILVLGATGMLGRAAVEGLSRGESTLRVEPSSRHGETAYRYDVADGYDALRRILAQSGCRYVLNAIGVLDAEIDRTDPASVMRAVAANAHFPHLLAAAARLEGCRVIHVSTDAVFSGRGDGTYLESAPMDPQGVYALSKALGESGADHVLNIRCSIVGRDPRGKGLVEWLVRTPETARIEGYTDYVWTPSTVPQLVDFVREVVLDDRFAVLRAAGAVVHFAPNPALSKFDFLALLAARMGGRTVAPAASPSGPCRRVLASRHEYRRATDWTEAVRQLFPDDSGVHHA